MDKKNNPILFIDGVDGVGKSTLVNQLQKKLKFEISAPWGYDNMHALKLFDAPARVAIPLILGGFSGASKNAITDLRYGDIRGAIFDRSPLSTYVHHVKTTDDIALFAKAMEDEFDDVQKYLSSFIYLYDYPDSILERLKKRKSNNKKDPKSIDAIVLQQQRYKQGIELLKNIGFYVEVINTRDNPLTNGFEK